MEQSSELTHVSRRRFILGGVAAATAGTFVVTDQAAADQDPIPSMLVGQVAARPSQDAVDCVEVGGSEHVRVELTPGATVFVHPDGGTGQLSDFAVGDTIVAIPSNGTTAGADQRGELSARRVIPCIIGQRSDVQR